MRTTKTMKLTMLALGASLLAAPVAHAGSITAPAPDPAPATPVVPVANTSGDWTGFYGGLSLGYADATVDPGGSDSGPLYGLSMGYDYDIGNWVLGAGLDYDWTDLNAGGVSVDSVARLKMRAGYDMGPGLLYGTAGGARAMTSAGDDSGWFGGVGYEHMVTDRISVGGEALYHAFDDFAGTGSDVEATTISLKTNFRF